jgi:hypothetical protein
VAGVKGKSGGAREGAGRKSLGETSKARTLRATDEQWEIIKEFARRLKKGEIEKTFIADLQREKPSE